MNASKRYALATRNVLAIGFGLVATCATAVAQAPKLNWVTGDSLPGTVKKYSESELTWSSPLFTKDLALDTQHLRSITFPQATVNGTSNYPLVVETRQGDLLHGNLTTLDEESLILKSDRFGEIVLKRSELASLRLLDGFRMLSGNGLTDWKTLDRFHNVDQWDETEQMEISTRKHNSEIFKTVDLPELAEVELKLSWQGKPGFVFRITQEKNSKHVPVTALETWGLDVVLLKDKDFEPVTVLMEKAGELHLHIFTDLKKGEVTVVSATGTPLAKITGAPEKGQHGIYLKNKGPGLTLQALRISRWSGKLPDAVNRKSKLDRIQLSDGMIATGQVKRYDPATQSLMIAGEGEEALDHSVSLDALDALHFSTGAKLFSKDRAEVRFQDGMVVRGRFAGLTPTHATMKISAVTAPIRLDLKGCRLIRWPNANQQQDEAGDLLHWKGGHSQGILGATLNGEFPLGWKPHGARDSVPLAEDGKLHIVRKGQIPVEQKSDLIHLTNRIAYPARILGIGKDGVRIEAPFLPAPVTLAHASLKAVQFGRSQTSTDFSDRNWVLRTKDGNGEIKDDKVTLTRGDRLSHPTALGGGEVEFTVDMKGAPTWFEIRMRLFVEEAGESNSPALACRLLRSGTFFYCMGTTHQHNNRRRIDPNKTQAVIRIHNEDDQVFVHVNGEQLFSHKLKNGRPGRGIEFNLQNSNSTASSVMLSKFKSSSNALYMGKDTRVKLLTLPRLRKSNPPQHIIAATNGDLVRGELLGLTDKATRFRSKLREVQIPRERIAGIVWLQNEEDHPPPTGNIRITLGNAHQLSMNPAHIKEGVLAGRSAIFGDCVVPLESIQEIHFGNPEPPKLRPAYADWKLRESDEEQTDSSP